MDLEIQLRIQKSDMKEKKNDDESVTNNFSFMSQNVKICDESNFKLKTEKRTWNLKIKI